MASLKIQQESKTIPLKILVDKQRNKVVFVETTKDFVDTLFSFLSLPLGTIGRLLSTINNDQQQQTLQSESSPFLYNIKHLYQTVQNLNSNDVWNNSVCKQMLLHPKNPCESLCNKLFLNIDDTEQSSKFFVCDSCHKFTTFKNLDCTCGKPPNREPKNLVSEDQGNSSSTCVDAQNGVFVKGSLFLVSDDMKILPSSSETYFQLLMEMGYTNLTILEEVTHNIGKKEILNLLKYTLTSHQPLTNTFLPSSPKNKENPLNHSVSAVRVMPCTGNSSKMDVKVVLSKSKKNLIYSESNGDFIDFIFSFLTMPLGSIMKVFGLNIFAGSVGSLYKNIKNLDSSLCTVSSSVLLNPGVAPMFGCLNQPLNIPHLQLPRITYFYGEGTQKQVFNSVSRNYVSEVVRISGGVISKAEGSTYKAKSLIGLDPRSSYRSKDGASGFVKRPALYGVGDDLKIKPLSTNSFLSYLKELSLPLDDIEMKVISIGEAEALRFLGTFLTSKFTLTSGLHEFLNVPKQDATFLKVPKPESTLTSK